MIHVMIVRAMPALLADPYPYDLYEIVQFL